MAARRVTKVVEYPTGHDFGRDGVPRKSWPAVFRRVSEHASADHLAQDCTQYLTDPQVIYRSVLYKNVSAGADWSTCVADDL